MNAVDVNQRTEFVNNLGKTFVTTSSLRYLNQSDVVNLSIIQTTGVDQTVTGDTSANEFSMVLLV